MVAIMNSPVLAWCVYIGGVTGLMLAFIRLTKPIPWLVLANTIRVAVLVLFVTPFSIGEGYAGMAPAWLMLAMEVLFEGGEAFHRVGPTLLSAIGISALIYLVADRLWVWRRSKADELEKLMQERRELLLESEPPVK